MPNIITTARGERVDLDVIKIKGQIAQAPMNIEVQRRKRLIDSKEEKPKRAVFDLTASKDAKAALEDLRVASKAEPTPAVETFEVQQPKPPEKAVQKAAK